MSQVSPHPVIRFRVGQGSQQPRGDGRGLGKLPADRDSLAVEEPLEIRLAGRHFTVTMRTPGYDEELVAGFLKSEGFVESAGEIGEIRRVRDRHGHPEPNIVDVVLNVPADSLRKRLRRNFAISSSCGLCGKTSIDSIRRRIAPIADPTVVPAALLMSLGGRMRAAQQIFAATGGLHAAALFRSAGNGAVPDARDGGAPDVVREDIGRHNAVDKVIGYAMMAGWLPLAATVLMVSGRLSYEIVQKAAAAGVPILAGVSAPSSLAADLADSIGMTLIGFLRDGGFNVYCLAERVSI